MVGEVVIAKWNTELVVWAQVMALPSPGQNKYRVRIPPWGEPMPVSLLNKGRTEPTYKEFEGIRLQRSNPQLPALWLKKLGSVLGENSAVVGSGLTCMKIDLKHEH